MSGASVGRGRAWPIEWLVLMPLVVAGGVVLRGWLWIRRWSA